MVTQVWTFVNGKLKAFGINGIEDRKGRSP